MKKKSLTKNSKLSIEKFKVAKLENPNKIYAGNCSNGTKSEFIACTNTNG